ncbi:chromosome partitioning protein, ParB family [Paenisporosarcina quisquiliarum]|jgi:ParB family chromosome partitioning protein|uniref:ParB/RepB/Spo0J family partition protein n=1 Tax=Psychrobacillus TaxID=1221880 RepID=UPI0008B67E39|nr:ParB/RepB/Spo0J family partition protein [Psychrobacillus psychrodurans]MCK1997911.1 ParB/RepB/Spo0J family partition protein [Psychrobacillus psychrodurans]MCZ8541093.1 ParB/RepB/Spo0J family partition protein [Psychrobacillus psychrodurans]SEN27695.1 chromosome partitioning protein, ParB family [Paenisporosarcina quisquiliarum]SFM84311.1 chromosome partitioning protein, ParB family [Psychrobacillus psychrodurans]
MAKGLGKGINALFPGEDLDQLEQVEQILISDIKPNPFQPRKIFDEEAMKELSESIKEHGVLQPIILRKKGSRFEIVVGERRFRASQLANLEIIPAVIRELNDQQMMELAILENLQREDLTAIEEAEAYQNLIEHLNLTQEQLAFRLGKSRPHIANHIRLLSLPQVVRDAISDGTLSMGHGKALLGLKKKKTIPLIMQKSIKENLNVRQLESLVQRLNEDVPRETKKVQKDIFTKEKESELREIFGTPVSIIKNKDKGKIEIEFYSDDDLERILQLLED